MTFSRLQIRHLCFTGPGKEPALIKFNAGLNVLYGASETGKSFVLEAIDFMLGGQTPLRDIGEREGYDQLLLGLESVGLNSFTLVRSTSGGQFKVFDGLQESVPEGLEGQVLTLRPSTQHDKTISNYLLERIGLVGSKILKSHKSGELNNLSFRNVAHLCLVSEEQIHKNASPIETGQVILKTPESATFKLLLTGVDDSAVVSSSRESSTGQSRAAKVEIIDEMLVSLREQLSITAGDQLESVEQLKKLEDALAREGAALHSQEAQYQKLVTRRNDFRKRLENVIERSGEIEDLQARFALLSEHYASDLARLEAIAEAGTLVAALPPQQCPLCGAPSNSQHLSKECDGNIDAVVAAAQAEKSKIEKLKSELQQTISELHNEASSFDGLLPRLQANLSYAEEQLREIGPDLSKQRGSYKELVDKRAEVSTTLMRWEQLADLLNRKTALETATEGDGNQSQATSEISSVTLDRFASQIEELLKAWNFPGADRVHFEMVDRDLVIGGRRRGSRGKGMRAITHAAFTVGLMEYCVANHKPHPGFVIVDSPLLAYREPEGTEDDLDGTDVQEKFYAYLSAWTDKQVFVIENIDPPKFIQEGIGTTFFSKNPHHGRYGLFPISL